jgi:predicted nucleic acid-binding protein
MSDVVILVDTNVISELMRPRPVRAVLDWFAAHDSTALFFSAIGEAELRTGAAILPAGKRRDSLTAVIDTMIAEDFAGRVLSFDSAAAKAYAAIAATRRSAGRPIMEADCQIAAIARAQGAIVATRNVGDFEGCGIDVIDPWQGWGRGRPG